MKKYTRLLIFVIIALAACNSNKNTKQAELLKLGIHTVTVKEVIPTSQYTYFNLSEVGNPEVKEGVTVWAAVPFMEAAVGDTLYYKGGYPMKDFKSKELNRTFQEVLFLDSLSKSSEFVKVEIAAVPAHANMSSSDSLTPGKPLIEKMELKIEPLAGGVRIADLYAKRDTYSGKTIKVKGHVTKFSPEIMEKNWVHLQDGTESNGKFDLTVTTDQTVKVGDVVVFEGKIALDKDLGYNYFYEVIMEDAKIIK